LVIAVATLEIDVVAGPLRVLDAWNLMLQAAGVGNLRMQVDDVENMRKHTVGHVHHTLLEQPADASSLGLLERTSWSWVTL
jgi:hypothetical protein